MGSVRLPRKVLRKASGVVVIDLLLQRLSRSTKVDEVVLAIPQQSDNDGLARHVEGLGYRVFRGSEHDVLDRYYNAAIAAEADAVVRITGDCPLVDPEIVDRVVTILAESGADYASNVEPPTFPDGFDVEVCTLQALERCWREAVLPGDREHVTTYIRASETFKRVNFACSRPSPELRATVDEPADLDALDRIVAHFSPRLDFTWADVLMFLQQNPGAAGANTELERNAGALQSTGAKFWRRARSVIPGGSMLLSKRAELYLPGRWPAYFRRAKGCRVWDLDDIEYIDMSAMGIGTNTLGYGHPEVDQAVLDVVRDGNMSTLNSPEEVLLAERLIELHRWADMVRFARSGGEANAIAIRIARAASGRDKIAFCGYHGWHDWYLAANVGSDDSLRDHLLPGLDARGVPKGLAGTALPFSYNRFDELEALADEHDLGVIIMEVVRSRQPDADFLQKVRHLATRKNIVLVFDECTSGFRQALGGIHKLYGVEPDMAMFGKALGNGYAVNAVVGRREVMEAAQTTFISSTFWTERIGAAAGLKTLEVMERIASYDQITATGQAIGARWRELASRHRLPLTLTGIPALIGFELGATEPLKAKTLITQEMLKSGFLATQTVYVCIEHSAEILQRYFEALDPVFAAIAECENGRSIDSLLEGPVTHTGFKRLN